METGDMSRIIRFQRIKPGKNKAGQKNTGWEDIPNRPKMWSKYIEDKGSETSSADNRTAVKRGRWKIHYRRDLDESMTILADDRRWDIINIQELSLRRGLMIHAIWTQGHYD